MRDHEERNPPSDGGDDGEYTFGIDVFDIEFEIEAEILEEHLNPTIIGPAFACLSSCSSS